MVLIWEAELDNLRGSDLICCIEKKAGAWQKEEKGTPGL